MVSVSALCGASFGGEGNDARAVASEHGGVKTPAYTGAKEYSRNLWRTLVDSVIGPSNSVPFGRF